MTKFTAQIDLSNYFEDERKMVIVLVDPAMDTVGDLQRRIERMLGLENIGFLCKRTGCCILPKETVEIVQFVKVLQAYTLPPTCAAVADAPKPKKSKKLKRKHVEAELEVQEEQEEQATPPPQHNNKSQAMCSSSGANADAASANAAQKSKKIKTRATAEDLKAAAAAELASACEEEEAKLKRKRTRSRAKLQKSQENMDAENQSRYKSVPHNSSQHVVAANKSATNKTFSSNTLNGKTYSNAASESTTEPRDIDVNGSGESPAETRAKIIFLCKLNKIDFKEPRIFALKPTKHSDNSSPRQKSSIVIQENIVITPASAEAAAEVALVAAKSKENSYSVDDDDDEEEQEQEASRLLESSEVSIVEPNPDQEAAAAVDSSLAVVDLEAEEEEEEEDNEAEQSTVLDDSEVCLIDSETENVSAQMDLTAVDDLDITAAANEKSLGIEITIEKIMPFSLPLKKLPDIGDIVIFKMYSLGKACVPGISNFIAGKCEYANKRTKMLKLFIIDGHAEITALPAKFTSILDDSQSENKYVNVKLSELLEARVYQTS